MTDLTELTTDQLADQLTSWAGRIAAGEARLLELIAEFDEREGWGAVGVLSCAHWLVWKLGLSPATAREKVRVARALKALPLTATALAEARLSYAQARAITRVAAGSDEHQWVDLARYTTAAQLEKAVRGVRRSRLIDEKQADPEHAAWKDRARLWWDDDGTMVMTLRISPCNAPAVLAALERAQKDEQAERDQALKGVATDVFGASAEAPEPYVYVEPPWPEAPPGSNPFKRDPAQIEREREWHERTTLLRQKARDYGDWLHAVELEAQRRQVVVGKATLADGLVRALTRPEGVRPTAVQVLVDPMSGWARTDRDEMLPPVTLRSILRSLPGRQKLPSVRPMVAADLRRYDEGRRTRVVTSKLRALLGQVDGECCRFPGCTRVRRLHAHHVVFWAAGGPTDLGNLLLVCARHHTLIHTQGFQLLMSSDRSLVVRTREGTVVEQHPRLPWAHYDDLEQAPPIASEWANDAFDLSHVAWVLMQHAA